MLMATIGLFKEAPLGFDRARYGREHRASFQNVNLIQFNFNSILFKLTRIQCIREGYNYYSSVTNINVKNTVQ